MEQGKTYLIIFAIILILVIAGSIKRRFHPAKFALSIIALFFIPGLILAFWHGLLLVVTYKNIWLPLFIGLIAGVILYHLVLKRLFGFSTFEHELSHALVALFFLRRIKKFVVTRNNGGYVEHSHGFGGEVGNHFVSLGPYFLPTFTLISVLLRPFLPVEWFPWFDVWIGITFSYQTMNNLDELKDNWTRKGFRLAGSGDYTKTDIGREGYIFSFIMIIALKLLLISLLMFILVKGYPAFREWLIIIWSESLDFFRPVFTEMFYYLKHI